MTLDVQQIFKVKGSKVKVSVWHNVSPAKDRYISRSDTFADFKLCESYTTVYR